MPPFAIRGPLTRALIDLLWPASCLACGGESEADPQLCSTCLSNWPRAWPASCRLCAAPLVSPQSERCLGCRRRRRPWSRLEVAGDYAAPLRPLIHRLKFGRERAAAGPLASLLRCREAAADPERADRRVDLVVPIPLTAGRLRERGFNQVELIGAPLAPLLDAVWWPAGLCRGIERRQVGLDRKARRLLPPETFRAEGVFGARVLLVDDVVTTGATLRAASRALRRAGAREVRCLAVARTPRERS
jgi:ComF family protein